ncbi:putative Ig domain-containing protein, partial [Photobacterium lutimaris]|uniref:putative Ig domain-containing protein n=2 Tax=Photobacterium lutimaris TaxID=388278 RepID=UPI001FD5049C
MVNDTNGWAFNIWSSSQYGSEWGQTFEAPATGVVTKVELVSNQSSTCTIQFYEFSGSKGASIGSEQQWNFTNTFITSSEQNGYSFSEISLTDSVPVTEGNTYLFTLMPADCHSINYSDSNKSANYGNPPFYPNGKLYLDGAVFPDYDLTFRLTVTPLSAGNTAPIISGAPATSVNQDASYSFMPTASDIDNDVLTFSIENQPAWASFNTASGVLSGTPTNDDVGTTSNISIKVSDGTETVSLAAFNLEVVNVNDAPQIGGSPATSVQQDASYSFTPTASDIDNDDLTFSIENQPSWASFNAASGVLSGIPTNDDVGTTSNITIKVSDGTETVSLDAFNLEVVNVNDAPVISGSPGTSVQQDASYSFTPTASDIDNDDLAFSIENQPSWASFNTASGLLSGTPTNDDVGTTSNIMIKVSDGTETASLGAFNLEV